MTTTFDWTQKERLAGMCPKGHILDRYECIFGCEDGYIISDLRNTGTATPNWIPCPECNGQGEIIFCLTGSSDRERQVDYRGVGGPGNY